MYSPPPLYKPSTCYGSTSKFWGKKEVERKKWKGRKKWKERMLEKNVNFSHIYRKNKSTLGIQRKKKFHFMEFHKSEFFWVKNGIHRLPLSFCYNRYLIVKPQQMFSLYMHKKDCFHTFTHYPEGTT